MSSCSSNSVLTDYLAWAPPSDLCTDPALSLSLVPTEWPAGWFCLYFHLWLCGQIGPATFRCSTNLELFKQPHMCVSFCLILHCCLPTKSSDWCSTYQTYQGHDSLCVWYLVLDYVSLADVGYCLLIWLYVHLRSDATVLSSCVCVSSCIPLTVCDWQSDNLSGCFHQSFCAIYLCNHLDDFSQLRGQPISPDCMQKPLCPAVFYEHLPDSFLW